MTSTAPRDLALYRRLLSRVRPYRAHVAGLLLLGLAVAPLQLLTPLPVKIVVDALGGGPPLPRFLAPLVPAALAGSPTGLLALAAGLIVALGVVVQAHSIALAMLGTYTGERLVLDLRAELFRHAQRLSFAYHDTRGTADTIYRIQHDAATVKNVVLDGLIPLVSTAFTLALTVVVAARIDGQLVVLLVALAPVLLVIARTLGARFRRQWTEVKALESSALGVVQQAVAASRVVSAFGQEGREDERFFRQSSAGIRAHLRAIRAQGLYIGATALFFRAVAAAILFIAARRVQAGTLSLGDLTMLMMYLGQIVSPLRSIGRTVTDLQGALAGAERVFALLDEVPDVVERPDAVPIGRARGDVAFRGVCFAYGDGPVVLRDVAFAVPAGTRLGVRGSTGAGKTTLVNLLMRCFDPTAGRITLDGRDLRDYRLADLRNQFAVVLQDSVLFTSSIAENIAYGEPGAGDEQIEAAARAAGIHDFIAALPEGYATPVGERGMTLSGGERQRIALARAFLRDAPILILDEPTSSLDVATEAAVLEALRRLMHGRTTFVISHRDTLLDVCDRVLEVERGGVVRLGPEALGAHADRWEAAGPGPPMPCPTGGSYG